MTVLVMEQVPVRKGHVKQVSFVAKAAHARAFNRNVEHNLNGFSRNYRGVNSM